MYDNNNNDNSNRHHHHLKAKVVLTYSVARVGVNGSGSRPLGRLVSQSLLSSEVSSIFSSFRQKPLTQSQQNSYCILPATFNDQILCPLMTQVFQTSTKVSERHKLEAQHDLSECLQVHNHYSNIPCSTNTIF